MRAEVTARVVRHWMLQGLNRRQVARVLRVRTKRVYEALPVNDRDLLHSGRLVKIGGVLAKRCFGCGVTKELARFPANSERASGCESRCIACRGGRED